ncbi:hypothetical protein, partial [uncultured Desulfovibrio sp.]|uniref:hypothetical protein n=1 Tax=uncultured Desulfovibrio sp. TaxID=167968 RepID=UPI00272B372D
SFNPLTHSAFGDSQGVGNYQNMLLKFMACPGESWSLFLPSQAKAAMRIRNDFCRQARAWSSVNVPCVPEHLPNESR